jgi:hypothetical protein
VVNIAQGQKDKKEIAYFLKSGKEKLCFNPKREWL